MNKTEILLKEYDAVRQEIITGISHRTTILSAGITALGILITTSAVVSKDNIDVTTLLLLFLLPIISNIFLSIWFGEYRRVQNAGKFIYKLEERINTKCYNYRRFKEKVLTFETNTRENRKVKIIIFDPSVLVFTILSMFSTIIGLLLIQYCKSINNLLVLILGIMVGIVSLFVALITTIRINQFRK